jgi:Protein of unknown function (DUF3147)
MHEHVVRFVLGGAVTVAAGLIARHWGPVVGGLFLAFPAIFPAGATLLEEHEVQKKAKIGCDGRRRGRDAALDALGAVGLGPSGWYSGGCCRRIAGGCRWDWRWWRGWWCRGRCGF